MQLLRFDSAPRSTPVSPSSKIAGGYQAYASTLTGRSHVVRGAITQGGSVIGAPHCNYTTVLQQIPECQLGLVRLVALVVLDTRGGTATSPQDHNHRRHHQHT
eukprot:3937563-Rhodomonas_salina.1